ncbi:hypothetical protein ACJX0J_021166, partial [Zea mays]
LAPLSFKCLIHYYLRVKFAHVKLFTQGSCIPAQTLRSLMIDQTVLVAPPQLY